MRWILAAVLVIGLLIGGAFATGLVRLGGSPPPVASVAPRPATPTAVAPRAAAEPAMDDAAPLRPAGAAEDRPVMQLQVVLDRLGFSPGVIDGREGASLTAALRGFQRGTGLVETGDLDKPTRTALARWDRIASTRTVTVDPAFAAGPFAGSIPRAPADQARLPALDYADLMEKLAERFHTTPDTIRSLNPAPGFVLGAGARVVVPNAGGGPAVADAAGDPKWLATLAALGVASAQPRAERIVVDKSDKVLMAFDGDGRLIASFPATMGSAHDPLPLGDWRIRGVEHNPPFHYNPALFWDATDSRRLTLPPGPNSPVGVVWIDLSREHYGIHGTPEPRTIGRTESHGCIRLTNWDAARLAQMVRPGVVATFQP